MKRAENKLQVYLLPDTKKAIKKMAKDQDRSESYIASKILDTAILVKDVDK